jgi:hypothetical protein
MEAEDDTQDAGAIDMAAGTIVDCVVRSLQNPQPAPDTYLHFATIPPHMATTAIKNLDDAASAGTRLSYNSKTLDIDALVSPSHTHDIGQAWLNAEFCRMAFYRFINISELSVLTVAAGTSTLILPHVCCPRSLI